jgi:hypothetical protein
MISVQTSSPDLVAALAAQTAALQAHTAALNANTAALKSETAAPRKQASDGSGAEAAFYHEADAAVRADGAKAP